MIENSCIFLQHLTGTNPLAYYSHVIPTTVALFLSIFALIKTRASKLSVVFTAFTVGFSLWLIGDLLVWVSSDYNLIYFAWSWLDFVNIVFFLFGALFFGVLAKGRIPWWEKVLFLILCMPAFLITVTGQSVLEFAQPVCEASNNELLTNYKLFVELVAVFFMTFSYVLSLKGSAKGKRFQLSIVFLAMLLFFAVFAGTEYLASITEIYEINLYGLFILPLFVMVMVFAITNLGVFSFRLLGSQILSYVLIIVSGSQLLFIQDSTHMTLSALSLITSMIFALLLLNNSQKEEKVRIRVEELARELDAANSQQVVLIHFITHQIKGFVSKSRNIFSLMVEGDYGILPEQAKAAAQTGFESDTKGAQTIQEILNAANIKSGKVNYAMEAFDLTALVESIATDLKPLAEAKGLTLTTSLVPVTFTGDKTQLVSAFKNLIDNSIKYTQKGSVEVSLTQSDGTVRFEIKDTGVGIEADDMKNLFTEGGRGKNSQKINVESTGFGLYIVKNIIEAHKGTVRAESEGADHGSRFIIELPA